MRMIKKRIAIFLCISMAFTSVVTFAAAKEPVQAASDWTYYLYGNFGFSSYYNKLSELDTIMVVGKGQKGISLFDMVGVSAYNAEGGYKTILGKDLKGIKFESEDSSVVGVDSKTGKMTFKKKGTALVKATWKGQQVFAGFKVVDVSKMKSYQKENKGMISACKKLNSIAAKGVSSNNAIKALKQMNAMTGKGYYNFCVYESAYNKDGSYSHTECVMYSADVIRAYGIQATISEYFYKNSPFSTSSSNCFKITSVSGKGKKVTATLKDKVSGEQMDGAKYKYSWSDDSVLDKRDLTFDIYIRDVKSGDIYLAKATIEEGFRDIKIKSSKSLIKGRRYELVQSEWYDEWYEALNWIHQGVSTFTAK